SLTTWRRSWATPRSVGSARWRPAPSVPPWTSACWRVPD
ncbi:uncharacterized protein METZ01_LOCUS301198, partial [marine metagenome]